MISRRSLVMAVPAISIAGSTVASASAAPTQAPAPRFMSLTAWRDYLLPSLSSLPRPENVEFELTVDSRVDVVWFKAAKRIDGSGRLLFQMRPLLKRDEIEDHPAPATLAMQRMRLWASEFVASPT